MLVVAAYIVEHTLAGLYIVQFAACHLLRIVCVVCVLFIQVIAQLVVDDLLFLKLVFQLLQFVLFLADGDLLPDEHSDHEARKTEHGDL